jgi:hypothetical protein
MQNINVTIYFSLDRKQMEMVGSKQMTGARPFFLRNFQKLGNQPQPDPAALLDCRETHAKGRGHMNWKSNILFRISSARWEQMARKHGWYIYFNCMHC